MKTKVCCERILCTTSSTYFLSKFFICMLRDIHKYKYRNRRTESKQERSEKYNYRTEYFSPECYRRHISKSNSGHRDYPPPKTLKNIFKSGIDHMFKMVDNTRKNYKTREKYPKSPRIFSLVAYHRTEKSLYEWSITREIKKPEDSKNPENLQYLKSSKWNKKKSKKKRSKRNEFNSPLEWKKKLFFIFCRSESIEIFYQKYGRYHKICYEKCKKKTKIEALDTRKHQRKNAEKDTDLNKNIELSSKWMFSIIKDIIVFLTDKECIKSEKWFFEKWKSHKKYYKILLNISRSITYFSLTKQIFPYFESAASRFKTVGCE